MTKTKHTPGRWEVKGGENAIRVEGGKDIGYGRTVVSFVASSRGARQDLANARLIASAPMMLSALKAICNELGVPQPGYPQPVANAYEIAKEAIARATNE